MEIVSSERKLAISEKWHHWRNRVNWKLVKKVLSLLFFAAVAYLLVSKATEVEWGKVAKTLRETSPLTLLTGLGLGLLCYSFYAGYDLFGRHLLRLPVARYKAWLAAWISYACNLNLGALVGSVAFRYRLYSRIGVKSGDVTKILGISVATNWMGYILLAGGLFAFGAINPPESWAVGQGALRALGVAFLLVIAGYLYLCAFSKRREYSIRGQTILLPSARLAILQFAVACTHWTLMALTIHQFFPEDVAFTTVYAVLLVSCLAGALAHIPGGLGVLEAVFITLLAGQMERYEILAGVFAYRCVFYLAPLALAIPVYIGYEAAFRGGESESKTADASAK